MAVDFPWVADFPCYNLVGAVVPSFVVVDYTPGYSVAFVHSYWEVVVEVVQVHEANRDGLQGFDHIVNMKQVTLS